MKLRRYKRDSERLEKTTGIILNQEIKDKIENFAKDNDIENMSFSYKVRAILDLGFKKAEELKKKKDENNISIDKNDNLKNNGIRI